MEKPPYSDDEKLAYLLGQVKALSSIVQIFVAAHPNPKAILEKSGGLAKTLEDQSLFQSLPDAYADGLTDLRLSFEKAIAIFEAQRLSQREN